MSIKQILDNLLNKKWDWEDLIYLIFMIVIAKYIYYAFIRYSNWNHSLFLLFNISDETKEESKEI